MDDISKLISKPWQKFLIKINNIDLDSLDWKEPQFLGYICKHYERIFGHKFALSLKGPPSKCAEIYMIKRMITMLNTTNSSIIRDYIDWVIKTKIESKKTKIRSLGLFATPNFVNEFYNLPQNKIQKSTELPIEYKQIAETLQIPVTTYGDLAFAKMSLDQFPDSESRAPYRSLFITLKTLGFESTILSTLI